ncbi:neutral ceramidase [Leptospira kobayashii]|uniref:Neutral ceramidase n=1 Tax=Leptospira kobayashii TaxID=1917830 RepID=A0ABN6KEG7_9LEPT|nr:neutral/alkaline non-lysosomal ceramidase N-terminal domain-containing protein [Leptospira kobayashii]BDA79403.1 neutral ceramidase [Leptospira kobayashii]
MKDCSHFSIRSLFVFLLIGFPFLLIGDNREDSPKQTKVDFHYEAGMAKTDITGPPSGIMFWGYAQENQTGGGIHLRQYARSLVIKDKNSGNLLAYVTAELGAVPFEVQRDVVAKLANEVNPAFTFANVLINASHTHSTPSGYFHNYKYNVYTTKFYPTYYKILTDRIFESIKTAYSKLEPVKIVLGKTMIEGAGINRSLVAYMANPEEERRKYDSDIDKTMFQLTIQAEKRNLGFVNWYGVHPTNITFDNYLISTDNKGVASYLSEKKEKENGNPDFVAIFAQANEGDVSPNLNLNNTGPGKDIYDSANIIGERQFSASRNILNSNSSRVLPPGLSYRQSFIDLSKLVVRKEFSGTGKEERTCPSAYGYAWAGGSTEEGGGHWLFKEGLTVKDRKFYIDTLAAFLVKSPSDDLKNCQTPKAILFPMGETEPHPALSQILPLGIVLLGDLTILVSPNEVTTMSSRRMKDTVKKVLGERTKDLILSGLTNDFAGYITTTEEYSTQQYEGGHTLHGPYSLNAFRQEYERLAKDIMSDSPSLPGPIPRNLSAEIEGTEIPYADGKENFEQKVYEANRTDYKKGESVSCTVSSVNPNIGYPDVKSYFSVERKDGENWISVYQDSDLSTKIEFRKTKLPFLQDKAYLEWTTEKRELAGEYRLVHSSFFRDKDGNRKEYSIRCPSFHLE